MTRAVPEPFFNFAVSGAGGLPGLGQGIADPRLRHFRKEVLGGWREPLRHIHFRSECQ